jgi:hypothetical protein
MKKTPIRRPRELPPDFPDTMSLWDKESRLADAKLAEPRKKKKLRRKGA